MNNCKQCNRELKLVKVYRDEGLVGEYITCRTIKYLKNGYFKELGCREIDWVKEPEYCKEEDKDFSDRKVFAPDGATCGKCGGPLGFYKRESGLWTPCEINGDDHWDICRENLTTGKHGITKVFDMQRPAVMVRGKGKKLSPFGGIGVPWACLK